MCMHSLSFFCVTTGRQELWSPSTILHPVRPRSLLDQGTEAPSMRGTSTRKGSQSHHCHPQARDWSTQDNRENCPVTLLFTYNTEGTRSHCMCCTSHGTSSLTHVIPVPGPVSTSTESQICVGSRPQEWKEDQQSYYLFNGDVMGP